MLFANLTELLISGSSHRCHIQAFAVTIGTAMQHCTELAAPGPGMVDCQSESLKACNLALSGEAALAAEESRNAGSFMASVHDSSPKDSRLCKRGRHPLQLGVASNVVPQVFLGNTEPKDR